MNKFICFIRDGTANPPTVTFWTVPKEESSNVGTRTPIVIHATPEDKESHGPFRRIELYENDTTFRGSAEGNVNPNMVIIPNAEYSSFDDSIFYIKQVMKRPLLL